MLYICIVIQLKGYHKYIFKTIKIYIYMYMYIPYVIGNLFHVEAPDKAEG